MNKIYMMFHENEDEDVGYLAFSCLESATEFATKAELEPFNTALVAMPLDQPDADIDHRYVWDGLEFKYERT